MQDTNMRGYCLTEDNNTLKWNISDVPLTEGDVLAIYQQLVDVVEDSGQPYKRILIGILGGKA